MTVKQIMKKNVVTTTPDATIECTITVAQSNRVGSLPVLDGDKVVGIITTNDVFYKILNPLMGIGEAGSRIIVYRAGKAEQIQKVMECINKSSVGIKTICTLRSEEGGDKNDLLIHLDTEDVSQITAQIKGVGFSVDERSHKPR